MHVADRNRHPKHERGLCLVNRESKRCWVLVSRCASTTLKGIVGATHSSIDPVSDWVWANFYDEDFSDYRVFAVLRNPLTRFVSAYVEEEKIKRDDMPRVAKLPEVFENHLPYSHFEKQCWTIEDAPITDLFVVENLDLPRLSECFDIQEIPGLPMNNQSREKQLDPVRKQLTPEIISWIRKFYWVDYVLWEHAKRESER